ncbi:hypothetical protein [Paenibacillus rhizophilus]|uniref:Uncharacterized protein n=1 Tax=Paenibacillus rhizophilus TaxID=1850366 RepID=A0A3N9PDW3_9BACL|nr:hypothetical protein [Paenibacillus rhizophilus]RQW13497.1 hypothetical protein EH198_03495 [Paenibacillus rhizophilus]
MKAIRSIIGFVLIIIILSSLGYIGWFASKSGLLSWNNFGTSANETNAHTQHSAMQQSETSSSMKVNPIDELQKKVSSANESVKQMSDLMSDYPYTVPASTATYSNNESGGTGGQTGVQSPVQVPNFKRGIYLMSESVYLVNQLNQTVEAQSGLTESAAPTYQTYVSRYNLLVQSQTTLNNVYIKLNNAKDLFLSNDSEAPAADYSGPGDIRETNKAIYQMAQTVMEMESLNRWVNNEIEQTVVQARNLSAAEASSTVSPNQSNGFSVRGIQIPGLMTTISVLFIVLLVVGLIGMIRSLVVSRPEPANTEENI